MSEQNPTPQEPCPHCGSETDECLWTQFHDVPRDEDHAPCGAIIADEDHPHEP